jgi:hypothetical protein
MSLILLFILGLVVFLVGKLVRFGDNGINRICVVVGAIIMIVALVFFLFGLFAGAHYDVDTTAKVVATQLY